MKCSNCKGNFVELYTPAYPIGDKFDTLLCPQCMVYYLTDNDILVRRIKKWEH